LRTREKCNFSSFKHSPFRYSSILPKNAKRAGLNADGRRLPRLQSDFETLGSFEDNVGLKPEIGLLDVRFNAEVPHDRGQNDFQFEHCVFASYAGTRPGGERNEGVIVPISGLLGQEIVGIEDLRVRVDVRLAVHLECCHHDCASSWNRVIARC